MLVSQILKAKGSTVVTIERYRNLKDAAKLLTEHRIGALMVVDDGRVCGILSERDVARGLAAYGSRAADAALDALMTRDVLSCKPTDKSQELMTLMTERRIRHLPVMVGEELVGMISIGDVVKSRLGELESESEAMQTYIAGIA